MVIEFWIKYFPSAKDNDLKDVLMKYNIICYRRTIRRVNLVVYYYSKEPNSIDNSYGKYENVIPDSQGELFLEYVCSLDFR